MSVGNGLPDACSSVKGNFVLSSVCLGGLTSNSHVSAV